jgi:hypothetical protein
MTPPSQSNYGDGDMTGRLRVLVACEYSGRVREAFRRLGHDAWSCDLLPSEDNSEFHFQGDVLDYIGGGIVRSTHRNPYHWDIMIAHPPCTYMANSGAKHLYLGMKKENGRNEERWAKMAEAAAFFRRLWTADIPYIAIENPVMVGHALDLVGTNFTQSIQPWQFGHKEVKRTCLWLKGLPQLVETDNVYDEMMALPYGERAKVHYASPGQDRWKERSRTYWGIADAIAHQWGSWVERQMWEAA